MSHSIGHQKNTYCGGREIPSEETLGGPNEAKRMAEGLWGDDYTRKAFNGPRTGDQSYFYFHGAECVYAIADERT